MRPPFVAAVATFALGTAAPARPADPPPCAHPVLAPLAFLAGDWSVRVHTRLSGNPADSEHGPLHLSTAAADSSGIAFFTTVTTPAGAVRLRLRLSEITADRFVLENHRSPDGGATWDRTGRAEYRRTASRP